MVRRAVGTTEERFWQRVRKGEGCWEWTGFVKNSGYGSFSPTRGKTYNAHRFSYELHYGPLPKGLCVLHRCDNKPCVRPDHLFVGTQQDNANDALAKGRPWGKRRKRAA